MLKLLGSALILGAGAWLRWNTLAQQRREDLENSRQAEEERVTALCFSGAALLVILLI